MGKGKVFSLSESLQWNGGVAARLEEGGTREEEGGSQEGKCNWTEGEKC